MAQQQQQQQLMNSPAPQQQQQQVFLFQQLQKQQQQDAIMSQFPSNIDAHLRPQQQHLLQRPNSNPNPNTTQLLHTISSNHDHKQNAAAAASTSATATCANNNNSTTSSSSKPQQPQLQLQAQPPKSNRAANPAEFQMAYQDAWRVCHPDFKRSFSSLEDACDRLLPYHVVADYEAEEDDKILDFDSTGQMLSRSQQWDHNIAAKVTEFTATFEKQVLAFNIISRKRDLGEFRTEEKLMIEQFLLQEERRALIELRAEMNSRQKAGRETHESSLRMAATVHSEQARVESQAHVEMMIRAPLRASAVRSQNNRMAAVHDMSEQDQVANPGEMNNGWGNNGQRDEKEPSDDFLNDEETEDGDTAMQSEWRDGGNLDLNAR